MPESEPLAPERQQAAGEPAKRVEAPAEHPALASFRRRTSRANRIYAAVIAVLIVLGFVGVKLAYAHGELTKVSFRTAAAPTPVPGSTPGPSLTMAWHTSDTAAGGSPYSGGIVVTFDQHSVNGRDAVTGAVRWHYTRSDQTLCSVLQQDGSTVAIYRRKGNCDEVTGFATSTGEPKYYRTLTDDGTTEAASAPNVIMTVNARTVHAFDNSGGLDRWDWTPPDGCTVHRALAGSLGVLISLGCGDRHELSLHDLLADKVLWTITTSTAQVPLASSAFVGAIDPSTGTVYRYSTDKGVPRVAAQLGSVVRLSSTPALAAASVSATDAAGQPVEFCSLDKLVTLSSDGSLRWSATASGPPSLVTDAFVAVMDGAARVALRRIDAGQLQLASRLSPTPAAGSNRVFSVGAGLLLAGTGTSLYR